MKAIVLAGGEGRRLRCIAGEHPKPMVPMLGKPMLSYILSALSRAGIREVRAALHYKSSEIIDYFQDGSEYGVSLSYLVEQEALGTAGAVRQCRDFLGDEEVLVIAGDCACDFDLRTLINAHHSHACAATLALTRVDAPTSYGLAVTDEAGRIRAFVEKPAWPQVVTNLVNTGIYVLSPRALDAIPEGVAYDFAKDLFPKLLRDGEELYGAILPGYWRDIGEPLSYYQCCMDALQGKWNIPVPESFRNAPKHAVCEARGTEIPCRNRAALMSSLSEIMLGMGADFSDGIRLHRKNYDLHICPFSEKSSLAFEIQSSDAKLTQELSSSLRELCETLDRSFA